jgi:hypothetical protein
MQPIRGPIDYNRYPPRSRRRSSMRADESVSAEGVSAEHFPDDASTQEETLTTHQPNTSVARRSRRRPARHEADEQDTGNAPDGSGAVTDPRAARRAAIRRRTTVPRSHAAPATRPVDDNWPPYENTADADFMYGDEQDEASQPPSRKRGRRGTAATTDPGRLWKRVRRWCGILFIIFLSGIWCRAADRAALCHRARRGRGSSITAPQSVAVVQKSLVGQNWLRARLQSAASTLETLPTVREARVVRNFQWPPQVTVHIEERQPFARVGAGNDWWIVDDSGMPFRRADLSEREDAALYAVTGPTLQPQIGKVLPEKTWQPVREFALSLAQSEQKGTRWALRRLYFDRHGFASLRLTGGAHDEMLIQMGADHWSKKLQRARQALAYFEATGRRAAVLNLISYSMPTWTPLPEQNMDAGTAKSAATADANRAESTASGVGSARPIAITNDVPASATA